MLASVHLVDGNVRSTVTALRRTPTAARVAGLRGAWTLIAAPLGTSPPRPQLGRRGLVAFWDDEAALDAFLAEDPVAEPITGGWSARLEPVRAVPAASGPWPGVPLDLPAGRVDDDGGPAVVLTIGRLRVPRTVPFLRASARAEKQVIGAPGLLWATGLANPARRIVATFSLWATVPEMRAYATTTNGHSEAIRKQGERSFHHVASFIRFRPTAATGSLSGRNPLREPVTAALNAPRAPRLAPAADVEPREVVAEDR